MASEDILDYAERDTAWVFVGAHPDDETTVGALLTFAAERCRSVTVVSLTRGQSGVNLGRGRPDRTLAEVRAAELESAARLLGCDAVTFDYVNGTTTGHPGGRALPETQRAASARWKASGVGDLAPDHHYARWTREAGDPADRLQALFRERGTRLVLALEPEHGFTGHKEHITTGEAVRRAVLGYRRESGLEVPLFHAHPPANEVEGSRIVSTAELSRRGGRDYEAVARASFACYESQFGRGRAIQDAFAREWFQGCRLTKARLA